MKSVMVSTIVVNEYINDNISHYETELFNVTTQKTLNNNFEYLKVLEALKEELKDHIKCVDIVIRNVEKRL